jgi:hypothetical protein
MKPVILCGVSKEIIRDPVTYVDPKPKLFCINTSTALSLSYLKLMQIKEPQM